MLKALALCLFVPVLLHAQTVPPEQIRPAASHAVAAIQRGATGFYKFMDCFSCHDHGLPMLAFRAARQHGIPFDEAAVAQVAVKGLLSSPDLRSFDRAVQDNTIIDPAASEGWALIAAHAAGVQPNLVTAVYARRIANWQKPDGRWVTGDERPPQSYSNVTATAVAARAIQLYMPARLRKETDGRLARAKSWLLAVHPRDTEEFTYRLFGLYWTGATAAESSSVVRDLLALQRADGGWAQLPHLDSDAFSTGEALVALHEAGGVDVNNPAWQKGLRYLLSTQDENGVWHVHTRMLSPAAVSPPYFETGIPYGHDQTISTDATCWAAVALMMALPESATPTAPPPLPELSPKGLEPWMETALFGTPAELKAQLDQGLDPNSKTAEGTTLLMMVAQDPEKAKLLIDRRADVREKAKTGYTALMVAATYQGTSESVKLLLSHGAEVNPGKGVMFDASPLFLAAFTGDRDNLALLLAKGADPNRRMTLLGFFPASPLISTLAFGDPAVVQALIQGGANVHEKDQDSMSPLHWAVIAHHADVAQALIAGGADVNAVDRFGYTPLHYAATIDFGDAETVTTLLRAGANPEIKDKDGRTALVQAREYPYIRAALEQAGNTK